ncbi:MAG: phosphoenolpyruvate kinase [Ignavibacteria bacterium]|nr:phosphoenolpyruvate kinase [Ignavibacteria bacterium]
MKELLKRQPVHVVYGGAQLFRSGTVRKIGGLALASFSTYADDIHNFASAFGMKKDETCIKVYERVKSKLESEAVEDYRIDFEDGFGYRTDEEEDEAAVQCARETANAMRDSLLSHYFGIRPKPYTGELRSRCLRTIELYLHELLQNTSGQLPENFLITLPKVESAVQIAEFVSELEKIENLLHIKNGLLKIEIMVETAASLISIDGRLSLPLIAKAGADRIESAHFGAFDYTAELGIIAKYQTLRHQACDFARNMMKASLEGTGIRLSDGATNIMPIPPHKGEPLTEQQKTENRNAVHFAWKLHFDNISHSLENGFYQGWDLHPAQLIPRYSATYKFFAENLADSSARLRNFLEQAARSTTLANVFDDAASGQGLLNFFIRGHNCGALSEDEIRNTGITVKELGMRSFSKIISSRSK